jgi:chromosome segregation ATPase
MTLESSVRRSLIEEIWLQQAEILAFQRKIMAAIDTLNTNIAQLKTDIETLLAQPGSSEAQVQAAAEAVAAIDAEVKAKLPTV